jgi:hypothetical protein
MSRWNKLTPNQLRRLADDPVYFAQFILGARLWSKQRDILSSVANHSRTAVAACHASGKTFVTALLVLWWLAVRKQAIAVTTAPTRTQGERVMWGEIRRAASRSRLKFPTPNAMSLEIGPGRYAIGLSTNEGVRLQGFHGDMLVILDEAPGIMPDIWEAVESLCAGGDVRVLALGNPVIASGPFYDAFTRNRASWNTINISAFDTPNLAGISMEQLLAMSPTELDADELTYLIGRKWVRGKHDEWGFAHPCWESRVLGQFPIQGEDALISLAWLERGKLREDGDGELCAGVDVAGPGESETVLCIRRGPLVVHLQAWSNPDPRGDLLAALLPYRGQLTKVSVDTVGIGYYLAQHLKDHKLPVKQVNVGNSALDTEKFANLKGQLYWCLRERAQAGDLRGLKDDRAIGQLAGIRYSHNARGQVVIESKEDARKRGVASPDRAEAVMLAFADAKPKDPNFLGFLKLESEQRLARRAEEEKRQNGPKIFGNTTGPDGKPLSIPLDTRVAKHTDPSKKNEE